MVKRARSGGETVAAAVFFWSREALYGRYWGAREQHHSLHFETCYHQGIDFCIERGIARFEPGTQGEHKVSRGFVPAEHLVDALDRRCAIPRGHRRLSASAKARTSTSTRAKSKQHVPYRDARRDARSK